MPVRCAVTSAATCACAKAGRAAKVFQVEKMDEKRQQRSECCADVNLKAARASQHGISLQASMPEPIQDDVCCGAPPQPPGSPYERPGYKLLPFVDDFIDTPVGPVPRVKTDLDRKDHLGTIAVRWAINRKNYKIAPGLYAVGYPDQNSPVLVTANYKLSFDVLRRKIATMDVWILVLDTRGINVWCAAGKDLFSTAEVIHRVQLSGLENVVAHRRLILPQLAATGVSAQEVKKGSGFKVVWGPIRANDIKSFLENSLKADDSMRRVTFDFRERMAVVPVELSHLLKPTLWMLCGIFLISGINSNIFSVASAWPRGLMATLAYAAGILAGAVIVPALLPWIPGRAFALKGSITGICGGIGVILIFYPKLQLWDSLAVMLGTTTISSYLAMNFTGSTPFTSPSGVEKEMRKAIPLQALAGLMAVAAWIGSAFAY